MSISNCLHVFWKTEWDTSIFDVISQRQYRCIKFRSMTLVLTRNNMFLQWELHIRYTTNSYSVGFQSIICYDRHKQTHTYIYIKSASHFQRSQIKFVNQMSSIFTPQLILNNLCLTTNMKETRGRHDISQDRYLVKFINQAPCM